MTIESLERALKAQPFRPFTFHLADGRELPVGHPEFIGFHPKGRVAVVVAEDGSFDAVDLLLVVSLRFEGQGASAGR